MTIKLYADDSLLKSCSATVLSCTESKDAYLIELDRTVFFPEGGGQLTDKGRLGAAKVLQVTEKDGHIYHHCTAPLEPGTQVEAVLDWDIRMDRMQQHCGEHLLSFACWKLFKASNVGFHMHEDFVAIDLDKELTEAELLEAEALTNAIIWENRPVSITYMDSSEAVQLKDQMRKYNDKLTGLLRIVSIENADVCTCCGTHPPFTGMVGLVKIIRHEKHKAGCRVEFLCGKRALLDADRKNAILLRVADSFSTKVENVEDKIAKLNEEISALKERNKKLAGKILLAQVDEELSKAPTAANGARILFLPLTDSDAKDAKQLLPKVTGIPNTLSLIFTIQPQRISYIIATTPGTPGNCQEYIGIVNSILEGRGGGKPDCAQGGSPYCADWQDKLELIKKQILSL